MTVATLATAILLQAITFTSVAQGTASQIDQPRNVVLRTAEEFQALWKTHSTAPPPKVDFTKSIVVGVFLGMRPSAGFSARITGVRKTDTGARVEYVEGTPARDAMVAQVLTSPFHLVSIPRDVSAVEFSLVRGR